MLYPVENEIREVKDLSGLWNFKVDFRDEGVDQHWQESRLTCTQAMPVPASYNDITTDKSIRDHIGEVWYEKEFVIPRSWENKRIVLRIGSATHHAVVWVNGQEIARHKGGFLPFEADITDQVKIGRTSRITLAVSNVLDWSCLPSGEIKIGEGPRYPQGFRTQDTSFDFYNYSGLHRPVKLYTTPKNYIADVRVVTDIDGADGKINYTVTTEGGAADVKVRLFDAEGVLVAEQTEHAGELLVKNVHLWQPGKAYLYNMETEIISPDGTVEDVYQLPVGIRTVEVKGHQFLINGTPFYFKGFGKHEDSDIHGKGLDQALNVKDFNLLKWMGANSFRTAHYPCSEEIMRLADREGLVVIDEVPAVGMCFWSETNKVFTDERVNAKTLEHHLQTIREMIGRDKNHPCVVMWSVANEAATNEAASLPYFTQVIQTTRELDPARPVTIVQTIGPEADKVCQLVDVICVNRYHAWYTDHGQLSLIQRQIDLETRQWIEKYDKPILMSEYGADTIAGFHQLPSVSFTEEFQCEYLEEFHKAFDNHECIIGEHPWAFADFATKQGLTRIIGNKKGLFTRQRQPKAAAFKLKERWTGPHPKWGQTEE